MRKFLIKVSGQQYEVEVEEVKSAPTTSKTVLHSSVPAAATTAAKSVSAPVNGSAKVSAPMPGNILRINVKVGDVVKKGQALLILEAMKMENEISAPADGKIADIKAVIGGSVAAGQLLVVLD